MCNNKRNCDSYINTPQKFARSIAKIKKNIHILPLCAEISHFFTDKRSYKSHPLLSYSKKA